MNNEERFKLTLFAVIRNSKVMPVGLQLGKEGKGISADEVRVIYDMHINYIDLKEKETE